MGPLTVHRISYVYYLVVCVCVCRVPFLMVGGLLLSGERTDNIDSAFFYGRAQVKKKQQLKVHYSHFYLKYLVHMLYFSPSLDNCHNGGVGSESGSLCRFSDGSQSGRQGSGRLRGPEQGRLNWL